MAVKGNTRENKIEHNYHRIAYEFLALDVMLCT